MGSSYNIECYIMYVLLVVITVLFIYWYVTYMKEASKRMLKNAEEVDPLNFKLLELDICGWNILHIIFFFFLCYLLKIKTVFGYICIFLVGVLWYFLEIRLFSIYNHTFKEDNNPDTVYSSISYPRADDLIFNFLGIIIHFLTRRFARIG